MADWISLIRKSLRARLSIWLLIMALLPLCWTTLIAYQMAKEILIKQATLNMEDVLERQENLLSYFLNEKKRDAQFIGEEISQLLNIHGNSKNSEKTSQLELFKNPKDKKAFYSLIETHAKVLDYDSFSIIDLKGEPLLSSLWETSESAFTHFFELEDVKRMIKTVIDTGHIQVTTIVLPQAQKGFTTLIIAPLFSDQTLTGLFFAHLNDSVINQVLAKAKQIDHIKKFFIVANINDELIELGTEEGKDGFRWIKQIESHSPLARFTQHLLEQQRPLVSRQQLDNRQTLLIGQSFKQADNWALVVAIEEDILLKPVYHLRYLLGVLVLITGIAVFLATSNIARRLTLPILNLTHKTHLMANGDLTQRIHVTSEDEIGQLGHSFNEMAERLDNIIKNLDAMVNQRTEELNLQNTELEKTIDELRQTQNRLIMQEKLASLGALTAGIAHEVKNPLNFINNFSELSQDIILELEKVFKDLQSMIPEQTYQELLEQFSTLRLNVEKIYEHGKRADSIVYHMLQHSRGNPGQKAEIDLNSLVEEYINLSYHGMRAQDRTFNAKMERNFDPTIPPVSLVPQEISRVLLNLLSNAYYSVLQKSKRFPPSAYTPVVKITTEKQNKSVVIKIWDNGLGISEDLLSRIFTPFFTTKPTGEGTGLGLSISYDIVVQGHGGTLTVKSEKGQFAEFTITLPIV